MTKEELKEAISVLVPSVTYDETGEFLNVIVDASDFRHFMKQMILDKAYDFDYMFCLTCIDWKTHLMMVYHLLSKNHKHTLVVKVKINDVNAPAIETVCDLWKTAIFHEREVYDLFGVNFHNHPDMRRLLLDENWEGYPLRKNYVDENMIEI
jgi:NADH:ubiquinone oxidoreductase subunit C